MPDDLKQRLKIMGEIGWNPIGFEALNRIEQLEAERDSFYMEYRIKCDEQTKALHIERDELVAALRYLAEAILTRADADYMKRQMDEAVRVLDLHGITPPVPYRAAIAKGEK